MFEWDPRKAASNLRKHGVSFEEAATVFGDVRAVLLPDPQHSTVEVRFIRLGTSVLGRLLVVAYTVRGESDGDTTFRLISARRASRKERPAYPARATD